MSTANTVEVRRPRVTISEEATDSVTLKWTVPVSSFLDGSPSAKYSSHKSGGAKVDNPTASELIDKIAVAQTAMFEPPEQKTMTINDGAGNTLTFVGYDTGPHHDIMFGGVNNGKNIVHRCARLFFINTSIYKPPPPPTGTTSGTAYAESIRSLDAAANPCAAIKLVLEDVIKDFVNAPPGTDLEYTIRQRIHTDNMKILEEEWYPILDASTDSGINNFDKLVQNNTIRSRMYDTIRSVYLSGSADFSVIISQFESMFQMQFIPGQDGSEPGRFIPLSFVLQDPEEKEVNIVSLSMNPGPKKFLAPTAVAVRGLPPEKRNPAYAESIRSSSTSMVVWPETLPDTGQTVVIQQPNWLPSELFPLEVPTTGSSLDISLNRSLVEASNAEIASAAELVRDACKDLARQMYNNISLGDSSATIITPLNVSWEVGKRYTVKQVGDTQGGGSVLFSGFLRFVQHSVSSKPSSPEATTQLTFSHVEANGFVLPNK